MGVSNHIQGKRKKPTPLEISLPHNTRCGERESARRCYSRALNLEVGIERRGSLPRKSLENSKWNVK
jgi:hypothetical protein